MEAKTQAAAAASPRRTRPAQPARSAFRALPGTGLPAMPESPIPDLAPRNRTPDPAARHSDDATAKG